MTPKAGDWSVDILGQFFYILLVFAIVILLFLFFARWLVSIRGTGRGRNLRVVESCGVAPQSSVQILQAGERTFLIGVTKDRVSLLAEITGEALSTANKPNSGLFEQYLKKYLSHAATDKKEDGNDG